MSACGIVLGVTPVHTAVRNCTRDEGRPFEVGNQVLISSHRKLLFIEVMRLIPACRESRNFTPQRLTETLRTRKNRAISELEATGSAQRLERRLADSEHDQERDRRRRDEIVGRRQVAAGHADQPGRDEGREAAEHRHRDVVAD